MWTCRPLGSGNLRRASSSLRPTTRIDPLSDRGSVQTSFVEVSGAPGTCSVFVLVGGDTVINALILPPAGSASVWEAPAPVLLNTWKHHAARLRQRVREAVQA